MTRCLFLSVALMVACGCSDQPQSSKDSQKPADTSKAEKADASKAENAVRAAIADHFKVEASAIDMNRPLSEPPIKADELDLVELVMMVEDRLGITISDERLEELSGGKLGKSSLKLTPAQLVKLAQEAKPGPSKKKR